MSEIEALYDIRNPYEEDRDEREQELADTLSSVSEAERISQQAQGDVRAGLSEPTEGERSMAAHARGEQYVPEPVQLGTFTLGAEGDGEWTPPPHERGGEPPAYPGGQYQGEPTPNFEAFLRQRNQEAGPPQEREQVREAIQALSAKPAEQRQVPAESASGLSAPSPQLPQVQAPSERPGLDAAAEYARRLRAAQSADQSEGNWNNVIRGFTQALTGRPDLAQQMALGEPGAVQRFLAQNQLRQQGLDRQAAEERQRFIQQRQTSQDAARAQRAASDRDLAERRLGIQERAEDRQERVADARLQQLQQDLSLASQDAEYAAALRDPESQQSTNARSLVLERVGLIESGAGVPSEVARVDLTAVREALPGMSAAEIAEDPNLQALLKYTEQTRLNQSRQRLRRRGSGGRGGLSRTAWGTEDDPLVREAIAQGVPQGTARLMAQDPRTRRTLEQNVARGGQRAAERRDEGRELDVKLEAANDAVNAAIAALPPEGEDIPGVGPLDSLRGRHPFFQSQEGIRMRTLAENAVRRYLRLESGAAISDEEMESEMALRGMGPGATERQFRNGLADIQRDLATRGRARAPDDSRPQPQSERVRIRRNGREGWFNGTAAEARQAGRQAGFEVVE